MPHPPLRRNVNVERLLAGPLRGLSWDYPLSHRDIWTRALMQASSFRDNPGIQAKDVAHSCVFAPDLHRHVDSATNMAALHPCSVQLDGASTSCETSPSAPSMGSAGQMLPKGTSTSGDISPFASPLGGRPRMQLEEQITQSVSEQVAQCNLIAAEKEVAWLRSVLEGVVGLQQASTDVETTVHTPPSSQLGFCQCSSNQPQICARPQLVSLARLAQDAAAGSTGSKCQACLLEKNKKTISRRLRRNDCRRRYIAGQMETQAPAHETAAHSGSAGWTDGGAGSGVTTSNGIARGGNTDNDFACAEATPRTLWASTAITP